jgi:hypothetical protein
MSQETVETLQVGTVVVAANNSMTDDELDPLRSCSKEQGIK